MNATVWNIFFLSIKKSGFFNVFPFREKEEFSRVNTYVESLLWKNKKKLSKCLHITIYLYKIYAFIKRP